VPTPFFFAPSFLSFYCKQPPLLSLSFPFIVPTGRPLLIVFPPIPLLLVQCRGVSLLFPCCSHFGRGWIFFEAPFPFPFPSPILRCFLSFCFSRDAYLFQEVVHIFLSIPTHSKTSPALPPFYLPGTGLLLLLDQVLPNPFPLAGTFFLIRSFHKLGSSISPPNLAATIFFPAVLRLAEVPKVFKRLCGGMGHSFLFFPPTPCFW